MTYSTVYPLTTLFEAVVEFFEDESITNISFAFGTREAVKAINLGASRVGRVVFEPGSGKAAGMYGGAKYPGRNAAKSLCNFAEWATVYVWAANHTYPRDERYQYEACRLLHDAVVRAIHKCCRSTDQYYLIESPVWVHEALDVTCGYEIAFRIELNCDILDAPYTLVEDAAAAITMDANSEITLEVGDVYEPPAEPEEEP